MQNPPLTAGNLPLQGNLLFDDINNNNKQDLPPPPQLPINITMARNERTLSLEMFIQLFDTFKYNGVTEDAIHLRLFPFSLIDNAFSWLDLYTTESITTWDELVGKFLQNFFPIAKRSNLGERCAHHGLPEWLRLQMFYNGLDAHTRTRLNRATRGALMNRTYDDAYELIDSMEMNSSQWPTERYTYDQKPSTSRVVQEDDRYQQVMDKLNRMESSSSASSIYGGDKLLSYYTNNPTDNVNYVRNREGKEHVKEIALRSGKVLGSLKKLSQKENEEDSEDLRENSEGANVELEPEEIVKMAAELKYKSME
ncbi:Retrotransposon gag protein [Gossypium australe]|uniref:Retrotransposon gag protein n=1 Tax=Gossypium australe TaxID=47621 RepID=A0A5B6V3V7_9ROSI|nr:Retrotransposon gag protein [Gossypium australe]